ncbi:hypothetical protein FHS31_003257 [Sphingomonas vulcanisoli]|uniref:Methyltransferase n=1 Tax=Sphingomonas vulcanisoli TaxID=1658060 RepID=A0ABX0TYZ6_9SPHN|nr:CmcJ/NvfI family oxidoreductase [Sphingomonas vulcanisoli]NIJ09620.1 hypothetical protein [Sphingomonas vulcanisoli]
MATLSPEMPKSDDRKSSKDVVAKLNYVGEMHDRAVYDIRNPAGSNIVWDTRDVTIHDVRPHLDKFTMDTQGFAFVKLPSKFAENPELFEGNRKARHFVTDDSLDVQYAQEICDYIQNMTGARDVFPRLGGLVMRTSTRASAEKAAWAPPAEFVHLDFAPQAMQGWIDKTLAAKPRDLKPYSRVQLFQAWRCISPGPQDNTLAICDGDTVSSDDKVIVDSMTGDPSIPGNRWDSRMCHYSPDHRWYYMPDMEPDDLVLFKGYDSDVPDAMNAMHSAFQNPLGQTGVPRKSIEARILAFYD